MNDTRFSASAHAPRQRWMRLFALADAETLAAAIAARPEAAERQFLRAPEIGLIMVRGRTGGSGAPFNLGEMPVTRCTVALGAAIGHATIAGRDRRKAEHAAILDALMQCPTTGAALETELLRPIEAALAAEAETTDGKTAATRVDFFTMVRGD